MLAENIESTYSVIICQADFWDKKRVVMQFVLCYPIGETVVVQVWR